MGVRIDIANERVHESEFDAVSTDSLSALRSRVKPALQSHFVGSIKVRLKGSFHRLMLRDDGLAVRVAKMAFEHKPREKMGCRLGKRVTRIFRQFARFHVIGDDCLPDLHCKGY